MSVKILTIESIKSKRDLHVYYDLQMSIKEVKYGIQEILRSTRNLPVGMIEQAKILTPKEVLLFIEDYGYPNGYFPDEEVKMKLDEIAERKTKEKHRLWRLQREDKN